MLKTKKGYIILLAILIQGLILSFNLGLSIEIEEETPLLYVDPSTVLDVLPSESFTIDVKIADISNLYGFDITLQWDPNLLDYVDHVVKVPVEDHPDGVLHKPVIPVDDTVDETAGAYFVAYACMDPAPVFDGSGTIFLTHCNLGCSFCQNYSISHLGEGRTVSFERLSKMMMELQRSGCHNINFVSPTHYVPQILRALLKAIAMGLSVPLVFNTGGYDSVEILRLLDGVFDIYMPDFKYSQSDVAQQYSQAPDYPHVARNALKEMHRQVGDLQINNQGIALRGLLVRHLVLPDALAGTKEAMRFLTTEISANTYVNIMDQYYPCGNIPLDSPLRRRITSEEFDQAIEWAKEEGITRLDKREKLRLVWF